MIALSEASNGKSNVRIVEGSRYSFDLIVKDLFTRIIVAAEPAVKFKIGLSSLGSEKLEANGLHYFEIKRPVIMGNNLSPEEMKIEQYRLKLIAEHQKKNEDWNKKLLLLHSETEGVATTCEKAAVHRRRLSLIGEDLKKKIPVESPKSKNRFKSMVKKQLQSGALKTEFSRQFSTHNSNKNSDRPGTSNSIISNSSNLSGSESPRGFSTRQKSNASDDINVSTRSLVKNGSIRGLLNKKASSKGSLLLQKDPSFRSLLSTMTDTGAKNGNDTSTSTAPSSSTSSSPTTTSFSAATTSLSLTLPEDASPQTSIRKDEVRNSFLSRLED